MRNFTFISVDRKEWIENICDLRATVNEYHNGLKICFGNLTARDIKPEHIAPLACLIEEYNRQHIVVSLDTHHEVGAALWKTYRLRQYWAGGQNYAESEDDKILNLQRILDAEKELYGRRIGDYLGARYFKNKDMTPVSNSITEALYNIFDHADAKGNAFSIVLFDEITSKLHVAICDFGKGVAKTVKDYLGTNISDGEALQKAMEDRFTIGSSSHNGGLGLGNIRSSCTNDDTLWIVSNKAILATTLDHERVINLNKNFAGTLIFYSLSLSHLEDEEIIDNFNW